MTPKALLDQLIVLLDAATAVSIRKGAQTAMVDASEIWVIPSRTTEKATGIGNEPGAFAESYTIDVDVYVELADTEANVDTHLDLVETVKGVVRANRRMAVGAATALSGGVESVTYKLLAIGDTIYRYARVEATWEATY